MSAGRQELALRSGDRCRGWPSAVCLFRSSISDVRTAVVAGGAPNCPRLLRHRCAAVSVPRRRNLLSLSGLDWAEEREMAHTPNQECRLRAAGQQDFPQGSLLAVRQKCSCSGRTRSRAPVFAPVLRLRTPAARDAACVVRDSPAQLGIGNSGWDVFGSSLQHETRSAEFWRRAAEPRVRGTGSRQTKRFAIQMHPTTAHSPLTSDISTEPPH